MLQLCPPVTLPRPTRTKAPDPLQTSYLEIDTRRIGRNIAAIRSTLGASAHAGGRRPLLCGVVKKNAYGLGAVALAPRLIRAGCDMLAVFHPAEAEELVTKAAVNCPLLIMLPLRQLNRNHPLYRLAVAEKLHLAIHDRGQMAEVNEIGHHFGIRWPVHLYLDTGMSRSGLSREEFGRLITDLNDYPYLRIAGVYSHFATADCDPDFAELQFATFTDLIETHRGSLPADLVRHIANSFGMLRSRRYHLEMVRPGLSIFGYGHEQMSPGPRLADGPALEHNLRWVSRVIHVQRYPRHAPVGYGSTCRLGRESMLGVVPVGYGDGYPLSLSNRASVRVLPKEGEPDVPPLQAPVLGRVNMDQIVIDLTDFAADDPGRLIDAPVEVISNDPNAANSLPALAALASSSPYEMLCRLSPALPRKYV